MAETLLETVVRTPARIGDKIVVLWSVAWDNENPDTWANPNFIRDLLATPNEPAISDCEFDFCGTE